MKNVLLVMLLSMLFAIPAAAAEVCFSWALNADDNATGYRIVRDPSTQIAFTFPDFPQADVCPSPDDPLRCLACVPDIADGKNHRYVATAFNATNESNYSSWADVIWDQEKTEIPAIEQGPTTPGEPGETFMLQIPVKLTKVTQ